MAKSFAERGTPVQRQKKRKNIIPPPADIRKTNEYDLCELLIKLIYDDDDERAAELAKKLMVSFGTFEKVVGSTEIQLKRIAGVDDELAKKIICLCRIIRYLRSPKKDNIRYDDREAFLMFVNSLFALEKVEKMYVIYLGTDGTVNGAVEVAHGYTDSVAFESRDLILSILMSGQTDVIIAHNHPDASCEPSPQDLFLTNQLKSSLRLVKVRLLDHLVVGKSGRIHSMRTHGEI
ncbi:MAG: hypothetical protein IJ737_05170 [Ruminococcus sp.]|nr:hypothetical protein [Ruminococcus sp.]